MCKSSRRVVGVSIAFLVAATPLAAWTPKSQSSIARHAARLAPPDLYRQILRHRHSFERGVQAPFRDSDASRHHEDAPGEGQLREVLEGEIQRAIDTIQGHRPFADVVYRLGVVAHFVGDVNNPLNVSAADPQEPSYFADYLRYMESAEPRFRVVFYGIDGRLDQRRDVSVFLDATVQRARRLYPFIGREYRRIGRLPGWRHFDDRSTAFGVASISFSRAVSDVAQVLRYVWIQAGGADPRRAPRVEERRLTTFPPEANPLSGVTRHP